jgi:hypothetical protein
MSTVLSLVALQRGWTWLPIPDQSFYLNCVRSTCEYQKPVL